MGQSDKWQNIKRIVHAGMGLISFIWMAFWIFAARNDMLGALSGGSIGIALGSLVVTFLPIVFWLRSEFKRRASMR